MVKAKLTAQSSPRCYILIMSVGDLLYGGYTVLQPTALCDICMPCPCYELLSIPSRLQCSHVGDVLPANAHPYQLRFPFLARCLHHVGG